MHHCSLALPDQNQSHTSTLPDHTLSDFPKYCGIATPFHGICVYTRSALGMPSSNTECFMSWVASSKRAAVPDDLYCSDDSPEALLTNWGWLLKSLTICTSPFAQSLPPSMAISGPKDVCLPVLTISLSFHHAAWPSG